MNMNVGLAGLFRYGNRNMQSANAYGNQQSQAASLNRKLTAKDAASIRNLLRNGSQVNQNSLYSGGISDNTVSYADSIRASRMKAKDTSLKLKKLRYDFKSISSQILRSKTSASARQVASKARREVMRLKRQQQNGEYDDEELQSAIAHAQAMERVAKKKAKHLEEEEMVKVTGGPCAGELEEKEEQKGESVDEASDEAAAAEQQAAAGEDMTSGMQEGLADAAQERMQAYREAARIQQEELREMMQARMEELQEMMQAQMEELQRAMEQRTEEIQMETSASMEDMMSEMMDEMSDSMKQMLEDMGLSELADSMFATAETEMDPADYKMMKIKHRSEEMKAIAKADAEYLKALFDRLEKMKGSSMGAVLGSGDNSAALGAFSGGGGVITVSEGGSGHMPEINMVSVPGDVSAPVPEAGGFDISV